MIKNGLWRVFFVPIFEGQDPSEIGRLEDREYLCVGVVAENISEAITKLQDKVVGEDLSEYIEDEEEKWKQESSVCEHAIVVAVSFASSIDIE